jgi:hypothetical protein
VDGGRGLRRNRRSLIVAGRSHLTDSNIRNKGSRFFGAKDPVTEGSCVTTTTSTTTSSTTSTTLYGSPSRAFIDPVRSLLE